MSVDSGEPRQRTVAELLAENGGSQPGRRRRRRAADDEPGGGAVADGDAGGGSYRGGPDGAAPVAPPRRRDLGQRRAGFIPGQDTAGHDRAGFGGAGFEGTGSHGAAAPSGYEDRDPRYRRNGDAAPGPRTNGEGYRSNGYQPDGPARNGYEPDGPVRNGYGARPAGPDAQAGPRSAAPPAPPAPMPPAPVPPYRPEPTAAPRTRGEWAEEHARHPGAPDGPTGAFRARAPHGGVAGGGPPTRFGAPAPDDDGGPPTQFGAPVLDDDGGPPTQFGAPALDDDGGPPTQLGGPPLHDDDLDDRAWTGYPDDDRAPDAVATRATAVPDDLDDRYDDEYDGRDGYRDDDGIGDQAPPRRRRGLLTRASAGTPDDAEDDRHDDDRHDDEQPAPRAAGTGQAWAMVIAQWIGGAIVGAAVWVGFRYLWFALPVVALALAVAVTVGLVLGVRALLRNDDLKTTMFAVLVGLLLTVSPAILVLLDR